MYMEHVATNHQNWTMDCVAKPYFLVAQNYKSHYFGQKKPKERRYADYRRRRR